MRLVLAILCAWAAWAQPADSDREIFTHIDDIMGQLSEMSGLKSKTKVAYDLISRDKVNEYLKERVKEVAKPEEMRAEELVLKKFGLVPQDFNLEKTTVDLLTEQAAAFYDFRKKKLFITDWAPSMTREAALVHELAHALADQNFNLEKFIQDARKNDDTSIARLAVMEGQASWLMSEFLARKLGQSLTKSHEAFEMMTRAMEMGGGNFPVFENAPLYIRETLIFPYARGMSFQQAVVERDGVEAFTQVFRKPPVSTRQILHPDAYFAGDAPSSPRAPEYRAPGYKRLSDGTAGELDHSILLRQYVDRETADEISPHWRGSNYVLYEKKAEPHVVLAYASEWDDAAAAREFFRYYRQVLQGKWKQMQIAAESADEFSGSGDDGYFVVRIGGSTVTSLQGMASPLSRRGLN